MPMITVGQRRHPAWASPSRFYAQFANDSATGIAHVLLLVRLRDLGFEWPDADRLAWGDAMTPAVLEKLRALHRDTYQKLMALQCYGKTHEFVQLERLVEALARDAAAIAYADAAEVLYERASRAVLANEPIRPFELDDVANLLRERAGSGR